MGNSSKRTPGIRGQFAASYDSFVQRNTLLPNGLNELLASFAPTAILEFGVGTGSVATGLSLAGYKVTGVDISEDMLKEARRKARLHGAPLELLAGDMIRIKLERQFDLVICLGNTFPLVADLLEARRFLANCRDHLRPGGSAIFQMLNYDRILKERPTTFAVDCENDLVRIKQYRYRRKIIDFVVTIVDNSSIPPRMKTVTNRIRPWTRRDLSVELRRAGLTRIAVYGDYSKTEFGPASKDLIAVAGR